MKLIFIPSVYFVSCIISLSVPLFCQLKIRQKLFRIPRGKVKKRKNNTSVIDRSVRYVLKVLLLLPSKFIIGFGKQVLSSNTKFFVCSKNQYEKTFSNTRNNNSYHEISCHDLSFNHAEIPNHVGKNKFYKQPLQSL